MRFRIAAVPLLVTALVVATTATSASAFGALTTHPAGELPVSVTTGDINRDGRQDMAVANQNSGTFSVLLHDGAGGFRKMPDVGTPAQSVALADLDGDGRPDLATAGGQSTVSIVLGRGDGRFRTPRQIEVVSFATNAIVAADFDGDKDVDLAVGFTNGGEVQVLANDGRGNFTRRTVAEPTYGSALDLRAADLNRDGAPDLVAAVQSDLIVLLGNGDGTFGPPNRFDTVWWAMNVVVGDFTSDGVPDLVVPRPGSLSDSGGLFVGTGDGTFQDLRSIPVRWSETVAGGDFDDDGRLDLAFVTSSVMFVLLGRGDGTFWPPSELPFVGQPGTPASTDFTGDGEDDIAVPNGSGYPGTVWVYCTP